MTKGKRRTRAAAPRGITDEIQEVIDSGTTAVEQVHVAIANLPLDILEKVKFLEEPVRVVKRVQKHTIAGVYNVIRAINRDVGDFAHEVLSRRAQPRREMPGHG